MKSPRAFARRHSPPGPSLIFRGFFFQLFSTLILCNINVKLFSKSFVKINLIVLPNGCGHSYTVLQLVQPNGRHDVIMEPNPSKRTPIDLGETIYGKFHQNWCCSFVIPLCTDRPTHRQSHTQTDTPDILPQKDHYKCSQ